MIDMSKQKTGELPALEIYKGLVTAYRRICDKYSLGPGELEELTADLQAMMMMIRCNCPEPLLPHLESIEGNLSGKLEAMANTIEL